VSGRTATFTVVGCGTVVPEADRSCSAYLLDTGAVRLLLDCGPGTVRSLARVGADWSGLTDIWISHFHTDHTGDLPGLMFALTYGLLPETRAMPLTIWGPAGTRAMLEGYAAATGPLMLEPGFPVEVREVEPGADLVLAPGLRLRTMSTPHTDESLALRLDAGGFALTYSGDSGSAVDLGGFARGSDLFVCECSLPDDLVGDNHLSPSAVAGFAREAAPGVLLLTHVYPQFRAAADVAALVAAGYAGRVEMATEGWRHDLLGDRVPGRR
jgi:ribonuclease BN (tRNA processing enzyme)